MLSNYFSQNDLIPFIFSCYVFRQWLLSCLSPSTCLHHYHPLYAKFRKKNIQKNSIRVSSVMSYHNYWYNKLPGCWLPNNRQAYKLFSVTLLGKLAMQQVTLPLAWGLHAMETLSTLLRFVRHQQSSAVDSHHKGLVLWTFDSFAISLNKVWTNSQVACEFRHLDVHVVSLLW